MGPANKAILEKANEAVMRGDHEGFLAFCTDDVVWNFIGDQVLEGKEAVRQYMLKTYVEPPEFDVEHLMADNDFVSAIGKIRLREEGKMVRYSYCDIWQFRDGKMAVLKAFVIKTS